MCREQSIFSRRKNKIAGGDFSLVSIERNIIPQKYHSYEKYGKENKHTTPHQQQQSNNQIMNLYVHCAKHKQTIQEML